MSDDFELTCDQHSEMKGCEADISDRPGAPYSAWEGHSEGRNVELTPGKRIVQTWRTAEFPADPPDSTLKVELEPIASGTRLKLTHRGVPDGQTSYEEQGWRDNDFAPMHDYFSEG